MKTNERKLRPTPVPYVVRTEHLGCFADRNERVVTTICSGEETVAEMRWDGTIDQLARILPTADFIALACNCHDELRDAAKKLAMYLSRNLDCTCEIDHTCAECSLLESALAIIAKAEKGA